MRFDIGAMMVGLTLSQVNCGKRVSGGYEPALPDPAPTEEEAPPEPVAEVPSQTPVRTPQVNDFLRTAVATQQKVRKDFAQVLLTNAKGEVAIAGITRSSIVRDYVQQPSLAGDVFFTRYSVNKGWDHNPVQVPVQAPPPPDPSQTPTPLPQALAVVKGGRLLDSGKALIVGEMQATFFSKAQLNLEETKNASRAIFMGIFGSGENGMMKSLRFGLEGENTVAATTDTPAAQTLLMTGTTHAGLRLNSAQAAITQTETPSNYIAELDDDGNILRTHFWSLADEAAAKITSNSSLTFLAANRSDGRGVVVRGIRLPSRSNEVLFMPEKEVCSSLSGPTKLMRAASISASETEVVVSVEVTDASVSAGTVLPCFEVFSIRAHGTLISKREHINLPDFPTASGSLHVHLVQDNELMMIRSRENTDSRGRSLVVSSFVFPRPLKFDDYESRLWSLTRPKDWYPTQSVDGLLRRIQAVARSKSPSQQDVLWVVSSDMTPIDDEVETLVHIGTYSSLRTKTEEKN